MLKKCLLFKKEVYAVEVIDFSVLTADKERREIVLEYEIPPAFVDNPNKKMR